MMTQVYAVLSYSRFVRMLQSDVLVVLLDPGLNGMPSLSIVDFTTFTDVNTSYFQPKVILDRWKETGDLSRC